MGKLSGVMFTYSLIAFIRALTQSPNHLSKVLPLLLSITGLNFNLKNLGTLKHSFIGHLLYICNWNAMDFMVWSNKNCPNMSFSHSAQYSTYFVYMCVLLGDASTIYSQLMLQWCNIDLQNFRLHMLLQWKTFFFLFCFSLLVVEPAPLHWAVSPAIFIF